MHRKEIRMAARELPEHRPAVVWKLAENAVVAGDAMLLERLLHDHEPLLRKERPQSSWLGGLTPDYSARDARSIIADNHHFEGWDQFAAYTEALNDRNSAVARFEAAVDAIVAGDVTTLERLVRQSPDLIRARSTRKHRSSLLHYVGANGVEGFRQRTPKNAVSIAETLLNTGAEVDAVADMYGGATTLGLVATSIHPKLAGLQHALIDILLAHGAALDHAGAAGNRHGLVNGCLANGRDDAAEFLARRGAPLDLEGAAGVGWLDVVKSFFNGDGTLKADATSAQMENGFTWACAFGRTDVVDFLLERGMEVGTRLERHFGETGLHSAAYGGHLDTVKALLERKAPVDVKDERFGGTPLAWALYAWGEQATDAGSSQYYEVVALLVSAGATVDPEWVAHPHRGFPLAEKVSGDTRMLAALTKQHKIAT
jgi:ankyrin repeat protein